ncbi:MAG TPA: hypothetical protein VIJ14_00430, partial [Rhabdochlamydiaceae bacterium]
QQYEPQEPEHYQEPEPLEEENPEGEEQEEQFESPVHKKSKRDPLKTRLNQVLREKYQYAHALEQIQAENDRLKSLNDITTQAAMKAHDETVINKLERARRAKEEAIETGDIKAQVDADVSLADAVNEYKELENWKSQQAYNQQYQQPMQQESNIDQQYAMEAYLNEREFLHPDSEKYSPELDRRTAQFKQTFDRLIYQNNAQHTIGTQDYFNALDNFIITEANRMKSQQHGMGKLNMSRSRQSVAPVRGGYSSNPGVSQRGMEARLSSDEKDMARRMGIPEKEYVQYKIQSMRDDKSRGAR